MGAANNIFTRNKSDILNQEHLLWRALCHDGAALKKYLAKDAVLVFPGGQLVTHRSRPGIEQKLAGLEAWQGYSFDQEPEFVEIDMMAACVAYTVTLARPGRARPVRASAMSVWRQGADAEWMLCMHQFELIS